MISRSTLDLLWRARGDTSDAQRASADLRKAVESDFDKMSKAADKFSGKVDGSSKALEKANKKTGDSAKDATDEIDGMSTGLSRLGLAAGRAALPVAVVGGAIVAFTVGLAAVTKASIESSRILREYGTEIDEISEKTSIAAENVSALAFAMAEGGEDTSKLEKGLKTFTKTVAEAAAGSEEAADKLAAFGLDPVQAMNDLDGALESVVDEIGRAEPGVQQIRAATLAFGQSGRDLVPVINEFQGNLEGLREEASRFGVVLSQEDARAASEFDQALNRLDLSVKGAAVTFANEFLPTLTRVFEDISGFIIRNEELFVRWGREVNAIVNLIRNNFEALRGYINSPAGQAIQRFLLTLIQASGRTLSLPGAPITIGGGPPTASGSAGGGSDFTQDLAAQRRAAAKARREREAAIREELGAQLNLAKAQQAEIEAVYKRTVDFLIEEFKRTGDSTGFADAFSEASEVFEQEARDIIRDIDRIRRAQARAAGASKTTLDVITADTRAAAEKLNQTIEDLGADVNKRVEDQADKSTRERLRDREATLRENFRREEAMEKTHLANLEAARAKVGGSREALNIFALQNERARIDLQIADLGKLADAYAAGTKERERLLTEIFLLEQTQKQLLAAEEAAKANLEKRNLEERKRLTQELRDIEVSFAKAREDSRRFQAEQTRKILVNELEISANRRQAIENLRLFDEAEAQNRRIARDAELTEEKRAALERIEGRKNEAEQRKAIEDLFRERELLSEQEFQAELERIRREAAERTAEIRSPLETLLGGLIGNGQADLFKGLGDIISQSFNQMAQAAGNAVKAFVLFGKGAQSFRQFAAEIIASIAQMAVVQAVWNVAEGLAKLALSIFGHPTAGASAAQHFAAAAVYGTIGGVAALVGRGVAGDSFQNSASGGFGSGSGLASSAEQGAPFSSQDDAIIENAANQAQPRFGVTIKDRSGMFGQFFDLEINSGGRTAQTLKRFVEDNT